MLMGSWSQPGRSVWELRTKLCQWEESRECRSCQPFNRHLKIPEASQGQLSGSSTSSFVPTQLCFTLEAPLCWFPFLFQVRDDNKRQHPCLVEFCKLPEQERNYNLQMSLETLKWVPLYFIKFRLPSIDIITLILPGSYFYCRKFHKVQVDWINIRWEFDF